MKRNSVDHPHYPRSTSQKPQKGPEPHGFHGVPGSTATKARGKKILVGEQREELMPDPDRKIAKFPREWPTETVIKATTDQKKRASQPKATKAKRAVKAKKSGKAGSVNVAWTLMTSISALPRSLYSSLDESTKGSLEAMRGVMAAPFQQVYDLSNKALQLALQNVSSQTQSWVGRAVANAPSISWMNTMPNPISFIRARLQYADLQQSDSIKVKEPVEDRSAS